MIEFQTIEFLTVRIPKRLLSEPDSAGRVHFSCPARLVPVYIVYDEDGTEEKLVGVKSIYLSAEAGSTCNGSLSVDKRYNGPKVGDE